MLYTTKSALPFVPFDTCDTGDAGAVVKRAGAETRCNPWLDEAIHGRSLLVRQAGDKRVLDTAFREYLVAFIHHAYATSHRAAREMKTDRLLPRHTRMRPSKYLNNVIEQDLATSNRG